eukprot:m.76173 g.76173  ORF g.76173 m.76173 type:complete len:231 (-) comp7852_c1_seq2:3243-3935(-)
MGAQTSTVPAPSKPLEASRPHDSPEERHDFAAGTPPLSSAPISIKGQGSAKNEADIGSYQEVSASLPEQCASLPFRADQSTGDLSKSLTLPIQLPPPGAAHSSADRSEALADALLDNDLHFAADVQGPAADAAGSESFNSGSDTPPGHYSQIVPDLSTSKPPPSLPPHLLQVTLNSDAPSRDPTQLPEPNHVMLNHLYALAVKDSVVVLGATHRYRQKFVTTVLYKPMES